MWEKKYAFIVPHCHNHPKENAGRQRNARDTYMVSRQVPGPGSQGEAGWRLYCTR